MQSFYKFWWPTPAGSAERAKVLWAVKQGPLEGKAVAIITNAGECCWIVGSG